jgi:hypothetical protein
MDMDIHTARAHYAAAADAFAQFLERPRHGEGAGGSQAWQAQLDQERSKFQAAYAQYDAARLAEAMPANLTDSGRQSLMQYLRGECARMRQAMGVEASGNGVNGHAGNSPQPHPQAQPGVHPQPQPPVYPQTHPEMHAMPNTQPDFKKKPMADAFSRAFGSKGIKNGLWMLGGAVLTAGVLGLAGIGGAGFLCAAAVVGGIASYGFLGAGLYAGYKYHSNLLSNIQSNHWQPQNMGAGMPGSFLQGFQQSNRAAMPQA